jgi:type II secretory pathway pseudopilin PulG
MTMERHSHIKYILSIVILCVIVIASLVALINRTNRVSETENALATTQSELDKTQDTLLTTQTKLLTTEAELTQARADLTETENDLTTTETKLAAISANLTATSAKLTRTEADYAAAKQQLTLELEQSDTIREEIDALQANYDRMTTGYGYVLKDPTYKEMKSFLATDRTDEKKYDINSYVCVDYSADVKANAMKQKIRCAYVVIDYPGNTGHAIVAFDTTDRGTIYIEPQSDDEVNLQTGKHYYQCVLPKPGYYYEAPDYDDTIKDVTVIW